MGDRSNSGEVPSELMLQHKWAICRHNAIHHMLLGAAIGGIGIPLRRKTMSRIGFLAVGAGVGLGISLADCNNSFIQHTFYDPKKILLRPHLHHRKETEFTDTHKEEKKEEESEVKAGDDLFTVKEHDTQVEGAGEETKESD